MQNLHPPLALTHFSTLMCTRADTNRAISTSHSIPLQLRAVLVMCFISKRGEESVCLAVVISGGLDLQQLEAGLQLLARD